MADHGARVLIYDRTFVGARTQWALTTSWIVGSQLYRGMSRLDHAFGVTSVSEALQVLTHVSSRERVREIQFWGHGHWGSFLVGRERVTRDDLREGRHTDDLRALQRNLPDDIFWWFRTCETFGQKKGHEFARSWTDFFGGSAAGHTYVIGPWQSGLHSLRSGESPTWSTSEGVHPQHHNRGIMSSYGEPNTIHCLQGKVPAHW
jgi:hypothetical protein